MNFALGSARFVLAGAAVTLNTGPVTLWPATVTVMEPVVALNGTRTVKLERLALTTVPLAPLNRTVTSEIRELNSAPVMVTGVDGGPLRGETLLICGGNAE